ncbi:hypothetical protein VPNG_07205 [Cytospora leucostoma]|uniref:C2 domain-containing protein n=1 Tax=Cytospora leucostoma TaxID=1230097 RepID=A0A423WJY5_9PEZI|nr:hypothetical protein VPNG_07205 [Cytospora leucostoma]
MSGQQDDFDEDSMRRSYTRPHSGKHPIPTIQSYKEHRKDLKDQQEQTEAAQRGPEDASRPTRAVESVKAIFKGEDEPQSQHDPYPSSNHNYTIPPPEQGQQFHDRDTGPLDGHQKRKAMKKAKREGGREVTDPVTHLPIVIHDQTEKDMNTVPENDPEPGEYHSTATGPHGAAKSDAELEEERETLQRGFNGLQRLFPPPEFDDLKKELGAAYQSTVRAGLSIIGVAAAGPLLISSIQGRFIPSWSATIGVIGFLSVTLGTAWGMGVWMSKKVEEIVDDETWDSSRREEQAILDSGTELPESVQWLNSFMAAIWPLINPDLFSSLIDTIEDVMQASLPKAIKMVSVDDMGQGNQALRILGVRWLPTGAASRSVGPGGKLENPDKEKSMNLTDSQKAKARGGEDNPADYESHTGAKDKADDTAKGNQDKQSEEAIREGMEAEEGDFVNLELALAYRSRASGRSIRAKARNAHLFLKFYSFGGIALPVWVEVRGFVAKVRLRLQLTPDPPFVSLCTLTFLGQPRASMSCVPLSKHGLNLMDVPMISSFVQSAIDAAMAEYVAPKSLTLNLKDMLMGDDFKKDTTSQGVVFIFIKRASGFKHGDGGISKTQQASDSYVTVSWGKFGKTVATTRVIQDTQDPEWHEYANILVTNEELNAEERLRLQLWDSDKYTADDDLGRVEVDLKELMNNSESHNGMQDREDGFTAQDPDEKMPGTLQWSVGYFSKGRITQTALEQQTFNDKIRSKEELKKYVSELSANKLREAGKTPDNDELHQQHVQDYAEVEENMIISAPPSQDYCTIILNHKNIYRSRTKPKNSKPFFNAATEKFIRDWRSTEIIVSVRDAREREDDPLIGIVYLPLAKLFANRSQVMDTYPLVGGVGYGRVRISLVWRSVEMKLPPKLLGWDYGTLEIRGAVRAKGHQLDKHLKSRLKIRTDLGKVKMYPGDTQGLWTLKKRTDSKESSFLPVCKRYASALVIEFRESHLGPDRSPAFAVLWLTDLVDEEGERKTIQVWKGGKDRLARAKHNCDYHGLDEGEQPLGEVELDIKFWRGLSGYHKSFAASSKKGSMKSVMECLDTITDENLGNDDGDDDGCDTDDEGDSDDTSEQSKDSDKAARKRLKVHTNDSSSSSSLEDSEDESSPTSGGHGRGHSKSSLSLSRLRKAPKKILRNPVDGTAHAAASLIAPGHNDPDDASRGIRNQLRDYKDHHKQLHRKHRGIMQWRVAREADHLGTKLSDLKGNVSSLFKHNEKDVGVETEV